MGNAGSNARTGKKSGDTAPSSPVGHKGDVFSFDDTFLRSKEIAGSHDEDGPLYTKMPSKTVSEVVCM